MRSEWVPDPTYGWKPEYMDAISVFVRIEPYAGPGIYDRASGVSERPPEEFATAAAMDVGLVSLPSIEADGNLYSALTDDTTFVVALRPDGSGRLEFSNLRTLASEAAELGQPVRTISGVMEWTCAVHHEP